MEQASERTKLRHRVIYLTVFIIAVLMLGNIYLILQNNQRIQENIRIQQETEQVKLLTLDVIRSLHLLDLGLRGRALVESDQIIAAYDTAMRRLTYDIRSLEKILRKQEFPLRSFLIHLMALRRRTHKAPRFFF